jgi:hypothetical protein
LGPIYRPLHCHTELFAAAQGKLREGSVAMGSEMLRCAQHDRAVTYTNAWINLFMSIIGPYERIDEFVKSKNCLPTVFDVRFLTSNQ